MRGTLVGLAGLAFAFALAASMLGGLPGRAAAQGVYQVDPAASRVYMKVGASGRIGHEHGVQGQLASGTIAPGKSGTLVFDMRTFQTDTPEARQYVGLAGTVSASDQKKTNATMQGPQVLDVARFPTAEYAITSAVPLDGKAPGEPGRYQFEGRFTLHGVTRSLPLLAQVDRTSTPGVLRMRCAFAIQQSEFGITPYSTLGGLVGVADRLNVWGDLMIRPSHD